MKENPAKEVLKINAEAEAESNIFKYFGHTLGFGVAIFNLPVALLIITGGELMSLVEKKSNLNDSRMSDEWLEHVSETKNVSQEGLAFLAKKLSKKGYISGADAKKWLEIEYKEAEKLAVKKKISDTKNNKGATALLVRAKKECGALVDLDLISNGLDLVSKVIPKGTSKNILDFGRKILDK
jgi:hypothetical protein